MTDQPDQSPIDPQETERPDQISITEAIPAPEAHTEISEPGEPLLVPNLPTIADQEDNQQLLFQNFTRLPAPRQERIPHMGHLGILILLALGCLAVAAVLANVAVKYHLFGVTTITQAATDIHYTLGTEAIFYFLTLCASMLLFPVLWHREFFAALQWHANRARARSPWLIGAAVVCFILAMIDGVVLPGPADAPIDRIFRTPGAAWILFAFGVTLAPFFEELAFRGFLLPTLSTAYDWVAEKFTGESPHPLDPDGHPHWSMPAMIAAAILTSILFAALHADQTGYSLGPFLLLVCVSLVLCAVRLGLRSLAASVLVHATYNFLLFSFMLIGTGGFRHLENM
ncbi:MAG: lysostaphin resistance A-like protein [Terracidiphilus sp.]